MANGTPNDTLADLLRANIDLETDTIRVALFNDTTAFTFDPDVHATVADVLDGGTTAEEFGGAGGTGYSRQTATGLTVTVDDTADDATFDIDNVQFSNLDGETIQGALLYQQIGGDDTTPGDDRVIQVYDNDQADVSDFPIPTNGSTIELQFDTEGLVSLSAN